MDSMICPLAVRSWAGDHHPSLPAIFQLTRYILQQAGDRGRGGDHSQVSEPRFQRAHSLDTRAIHPSVARWAGNQSLTLSDLGTSGYAPPTVCTCTEACTGGVGLAGFCKGRICTSKIHMSSLGVFPSPFNVSQFTCTCTRKSYNMRDNQLRMWSAALCPSEAGFSILG